MACKGGKKNEILIPKLITNGKVLDMLHSKILKIGCAYVFWQVDYESERKKSILYFQS